MYISIPLLILQNLIVLAGISILIFSIKYGAVALIPLGILIDGYFGNYHTVPYISILAVLWYLLVEFLRPILLTRYHLKT